MPRRLLPLVALCLVAPGAAFGWGYASHRRLASHVHELYPEGHCLRSWLEPVTGQMTWQEKSADPDRWRNSDPDACRGDYAPLTCEGPRHYLDIDYASPPASYPREWAEVEVQFHRFAVRNGRVPWVIEDYYQRLVSELRAYNGNAARDTIAYVSHYVTDAASPMHTTKSQPGDLHLRYESNMLATESRRTEVALAMRGYYGEVGRLRPRDHAFDLILAGLPLSQKLIADDFAAGGDMTELWNANKDMTARRWADGMTVLASLVGTAWVEAGSPLLTGMTAGCDTTFPEEELVLRGHPLPSTSPDAGTADGGTTDAGGGGGGGYIPGPGPGTAPEPVGCGCASASAASLLLPALTVLGLWISRRRRCG